MKISENEKDKIIRGLTSVKGMSEVWEVPLTNLDEVCARWRSRDVRILSCDPGRTSVTPNLILWLTTDDAGDTSAVVKVSVAAVPEAHVILINHFPSLARLLTPDGTPWRREKGVVSAGGSNDEILGLGPVAPGVHESVRFRVRHRHEWMTGVEVVTGFKHRGIVSLFEKAPVDVGVKIAESICADNAFAHGLAYSHALETICECPAPPRASWIRTILCENERIVCHLSVLTTVLDILGLRSIATPLDILRERLLNSRESSVGNRWLRNVNRIGGVKRDLAPDDLEVMNSILKDLLKVMTEVQDVIHESESILDHLEGTGIVTDYDVQSTLATGVNARASGAALDVRRRFPYLEYGSLEFLVPVHKEGDCLARLLVRLDEMEQSILIIRQCLEKMPEGEIWSGAGDVRADQSVWTCVESPRGILSYHVNSGEHRNIVNCHVHTPGLLNVGLLEPAVRDEMLGEFPLILTSLDLSLAEMDR